MTTSVSTTTSTAASTGYSTLQASDSGTGIDYATLIEAKVAQRLTRADRIDATITENEATISAYSDLQDLLLAMNDAIDGLRNRSASTGASENLFSQRTAYVSDDDVLSVTADDDAEEGTYLIEVQQIATKHKISSDATSSRTEGMGLEGSFTIGLDGGESVTVEVESDDTLEEIRDAINAQKSTSGVSASIVQVDDGSYQLILTGTETGQEISLTDGEGGVLAGLGLVDDDGAIANELVAAQDAIIVVDGVTITRDTNSIDDAIDGLTIDLYAASEGDTLSVEIGTDLSAIKSALTDFVDAYNAYRDFALQQQATGSDGTAADDATLFSDSLLRQVNQAVYDALNTSITTSDGDLLSLADLGLTFDSSNKLTLDEDTLNSILIDDIDGVRELLGLNMESSSSQLSLLRYGDDVTATSFTLDITVEDGSVTSASVNGDDSLFTVSGKRLVGKEGTAYEGLVLVWSGSSGSVDVSFSQGLADKLYSAVEAVADEYDGDIQAMVDKLETENTQLTTRSDTIKDNAESYRTRLTAYYARLEAAAETANLLLQQLTYSEDDD
ncbi:flagellar filament capping protein FliD [Azospirillum sp. RWY-5-1]|uniref:Flagellar hook-associated protein 2 n=1 Tax=Azospirillum oleiclasticum TaxID=2735135 RepID=A0ABX2TH21_9PROT|nr:flagellar filament capping protein FliD [Azospirillum oleiclasticum]NYZ16170.1 flagellar filament capping protein FliD [Azospirillum oleiclasticum]NYZ23050.1 flagellar filament capping protein FliD [Azospirillum oleiclasticum]